MIQKYTDKHGIEVVDDVYLRSRIFVKYQDENAVLECLKRTVDTVYGHGKPQCDCIVIRNSDDWWDCQRYCNKDDILSVLFDHSLYRSITKFDLQMGIGCRFTLWLRVIPMPRGVETNIGPDLLSYISSLFGK